MKYKTIEEYINYCAGVVEMKSNMVPTSGPKWHTGTNADAETDVTA
jgi:hypothetical protein